MIQPTGYNPREHYLEFGDRRPPIRTLTEMTEVLSNNAEPEELVTLADMQIDAAVRDSTNRNHYFEMAWENMNLAVDLTDDLISEGDECKIATMADQAVIARLRMAELATWWGAAHNQPIEIDYPSYLAAADESLRFMGCSFKAHSSMTEFMPVLLGARGAFLGRKAAWVGRMALTREDWRMRSEMRKSRQNHNWDCSTTLESHPRAFVAPKRENRIQIKLGRFHDTSEYQAAGITVLSSIACKFDKPQEIIAECVEEYTSMIDPHVVAPKMDRTQLATGLIFTATGLRAQKQK